MLDKQQEERYKALVDERDVLVDKLQKLNAFVYTDKCSKLSCDAKDLLLVQRDIMEQYLSILNRRIKQFVKECLM